MLNKLRMIALCGLAVSLTACEAPIPASPPAEMVRPTSDPWAEWLTIANAPPAERNMERAVALASALATTEEGMAPMVEYLGDPAVDAEKKIVAIICLTTQRDRLAAYEAQLTAWTEAGLPEELRKMATHMLGMLDTSAAMQRMGQLLDDGQRPVREAAMAVLLSFHPELVQARLQPFWDDPETTVLIREQVILGMPPHLVGAYIGLFGDAATDQRLSEAVRLKSVSVLGQLGNSGHLAILRECVDNDPDETVKERARGALALLEAGAGPAPLPQGNSEVPAAPPSGPPA